MGKLNKINILISYAYIDESLLKIVKDNKHIIRLVVDSGAFTVWTKGKKINIDEYCEFIKKNQDIIWRYFTLDEIGNEEITIKNYKYMLEKGLKPIPIFTAGQNPEHLEYYYKHSDVVGLGGLGLPKTKKGYLKHVINNYIKGRKVHILGCTDEASLRTFKPYMCDSSSVTCHIRYGRIILNIKNFCLYELNYLKFKKVKNMFIIDKIINLIGKEQFDNLRKKEHWKRHSIDRAYVKLGYLSWYDIMKSAKELFDTNLFLAFSVKLNLTAFMNVIKEKYDKGIII